MEVRHYSAEVAVQHEAPGRLGREEAPNVGSFPAPDILLDREEYQCYNKTVLHRDLPDLALPGGEELPVSR